MASRSPCARVVGQQISVAYARTILARIGERFGTAVTDAPYGLRVTFPDAARLAATAAEALYATGITRIRAQAIVAVAAEVAAGRIVLDPLAPRADTLAALRHIRGNRRVDRAVHRDALAGMAQRFPAGRCSIEKTTRAWRTRRR